MHVLLFKILVIAATLLVARSADAQRRPGGGGFGGGGGSPQGQHGGGVGGGAPAGQRAPLNVPGVPPGVTIDGVRYPYNVPGILALVEAGEGQRALAAYEHAAADAEKRGAKAEAFVAHTYVAFIAGRSGQMQKAIRAGTRGIELGKEIPPVPAVRRTLGTSYAVTGRAYQNAGDLVQAGRVLEEAVSVTGAGDPAVDDGWGANLFYTFAVIANAQGNHAAAVMRATQALQLAETALKQPDPPSRAPLSLAMQHQRTQTQYRRQAANALSLLGRVHGAGHRFAEAEAALARARGYARLAGSVEVEVDIIAVTAAIARQKNDHAGALKALAEGLPIARKINRVNALLSMNAAAARSHASLGQFDEALTAAREAVGFIEQVRGELQDTDLRSGYLDEKQAIYQLAVRMALRLNKVEESFALAEGGRARAFLDLLGNQTTMSKARNRALVDEEIKLRARLAEVAAAGDEADDRAAANARKEAAERDYKAFLARVRKENVEQASLMSVEPVTLAEVQGLLPDGTTLLEYLVGEQDVIVWIVDRTRVTTRRIAADRATLVQTVRDFRDAIASQAPLAETQGRALALYRQLVEVVRPEIRGHRLLVVPHDVLHYLPFAALRSPEGKWLVEDYAISTLPSASVLKFLVGKGAQASASALAIGNPDVGAGLNLRWAEREARLVGRRIPSTTVLVRGDATETRAKSLLGAAGLIHFASHGELNESDPLASALLLTPEGGEDGRLEVRELFGLELTAKLVVLSACETGLGKLSRGDELVGLQRAFLYAGTPAVVTTLWKVDDRASYDLVRVFYERLAADGPVAALRQAQLATMGAHPHPFGWAAFGLTGAPQ